MPTAITTATKITSSSPAGLEWGAEGTAFSQVLVRPFRHLLDLRLVLRSERIVELPDHRSIASIFSAGMRSRL